MLYFDLFILVISHFGFEGGTLVLIASVPCNCLSFTFDRNLSTAIDNTASNDKLSIFVHCIHERFGWPHFGCVTSCCFARSLIWLSVCLFFSSRV